MSQFAQYNDPMLSAKWNTNPISSKFNNLNLQAKRENPQLSAKFGLVAVAILPVGWFYVVDFEGKKVVDFEGKFVIAKNE
jgi:hypothetical protein